MFHCYAIILLPNVSHHMKMKESNACVPYSLMFHLFQCFLANKSITQFENEKSPMHFVPCKTIEVLYMLFFHIYHTYDSCLTLINF